MKSSNKIKWAAIFLFIVGLTQSNLIIDYSKEPSLFGFPQWLWIFMGIHALFVVALYQFVNESNES